MFLSGTSSTKDPQRLSPRNQHLDDCVGSHNTVNVVSSPCKVVVHIPESDNKHGNCKDDRISSFIVSKHTLRHNQI